MTCGLRKLLAPSTRPLPLFHHVCPTGGSVEVDTLVLLASIEREVTVLAVGLTTILTAHVLAVSAGWEQVTATRFSPARRMKLGALVVVCALVHRQIPPNPVVPLLWSMNPA